MCLIIIKPAGKEIPPHVIESARTYNPDGFGIMSGGVAKRWKHRTVPQIRALLEKHQDKDAALHFRMATDGKVSVANSHPFKLRNGSYLMHNGILSAYRTDKGAAKSDTRLFIETFANPVIAKHGSIPKKKLEKEIVGNAMAIMARDGVISTYGNTWPEHYGLRFSNEYAWDAPYDYTKTIVPFRKNTTTKYISSKTYDSYRADDILRQELYAVADSLPLQTSHEIAYQDLALLDYLNASYNALDSFDEWGLSDEYDLAVEFIEGCSAESLVSLYTYCVKHGIIAA